MYFSRLKDFKLRTTYRAMVRSSISISKERFLPSGIQQKAYTRTFNFLLKLNSMKWNVFIPVETFFFFASPQNHSKLRQRKFVKLSVKMSSFFVDYITFLCTLNPPTRSSCQPTRLSIFRPSTFLFLFIFQSTTNIGAVVITVGKKLNSWFFVSLKNR